MDDLEMELFEMLQKHGVRATMKLIKSALIRHDSCLSDDEEAFAATSFDETSRLNDVMEWVDNWVDSNPE